ncbi:MAG: hypothetical protein ACT4O1_16855 [Gemmatimonadota bacterium]
MLLRARKLMLLAALAVFSTGLRPTDDLNAFVETQMVSSVAFVHAQDVTGRGIERHGHAIARTLHYRMATPRGERLLLLHLDPSGLVADFDIVGR